MKKLNIGFFTSWGEMGHAYMTKQFRDVIATEHETFIFAGQNFRWGGEKIQENTGIWNVQNLKLVDYPYMHIGNHLDEVKEWIITNKIDIVFFNECYDWGLIEYCGSLCKIVTYLDYFTEAWIESFKIFDKVIVCAQHAYQVFKDFDNVVFIDWGVDTNLFKPTKNKDKCTFFHSAGWGGINWRKCSPDVLKIFDEISKEHDFTLFFHSQRKLDQYDEECQRIIKTNSKITSHFGSVSHPGLYHKGIINVAPSKLEGLGLFLPEGLSCGMPTITTNALPMNQFVQDNINGSLVNTVNFHYRTDPYYFPEYEIDLNDLKNIMIYLGLNKHQQKNMAKNARKYIMKKHNLSNFKNKVLKEINLS